MQKISLFFTSIVITCLVLVFGITTDGFAFFTASEISLVKNEPFPLDRSITYGKLLDTYKYCKDGKWELIENDRGQKIVQFKAQYLPIGIVKSLIKPEFRRDEMYLPQIADYLESLNFKVYLIAQFAIDANGKSFSVSYLGTGHNGQSYGHSIELSYRDILKNDLFSVFPPDTYDEFKYRLSRFFIENNKNLLSDYVAIDSKTKKLYFISIKNIDFDDAERSIDIIGSINVTDVYENTLEPSDNIDPSFVSKNLNYLTNIKSINIKNRVIKSTPIKLHSDTKIMDGTSVSFIPLDKLKTQFYFNVKKLSPLQFNITFRCDIEDIEIKPSNKLDNPSTTQSKDIKLSPGEYSYAAEGYSGGLHIYMPHEQSDSDIKQWDINISTISLKNGDTCSFQGECKIINGKIICSDDAIKNDPGNYIEISPKENNVVDITKEFSGPCGMRAYLTGTYVPKCLDKTVETKTVEGIFQRADYNDYYYAIKLDNGEILSINVDPDALEEIFDESTGKRVSVTYTVQQHWRSSTEVTGGAGECTTNKFFKSGRLL